MSNVWNSRSNVFSPPGAAPGGGAVRPGGNPQNSQTRLQGLAGARPGVANLQEFVRRTQIGAAHHHRHPGGSALASAAADSAQLNQQSTGSAAAAAAGEQGGSRRQRSLENGDHSDVLAPPQGEARSNGERDALERDSDDRAQGNVANGAADAGSALQASNRGSSAIRRETAASSNDAAKSGHVLTRQPALDPRDPSYYVKLANLSRAGQTSTAEIVDDDDEEGSDTSELEFEDAVIEGFRVTRSDSEALLAAINSIRGQVAALGDSMTASFAALGVATEADSEVQNSQVQ